MASLRSVIWFCVRVPVLSTQSTVAAPNISTAGIRRVSTRLRDNRHAPSARKIVSTTGNSSGRMAIAIAMPARNPCFHASALPPRVSAKATTTTQQAPSPVIARRRTMRRVSVCSIVGSAFVCSRALPILPSSVRGPVAAISTMPWPEVTKVPENTEGKSSPPGRSRARASAEGTLRTGTDSPVSSDSSVARCSACRSRPSAGTRSPSARTTRSPATTSRPAIRRRWPSRITRARGLERSRSASSACSVRRAWTIVIVMTTNTKPSSINASAGSPRRRYTTPAATSMRNIGSRTTSRTMVSRLRFCCAGSSFGPSCCKRARASTS